MDKLAILFGILFLVATLVAVFLLIRLLIIRSDLRKIREELVRNRAEGYDRQITTTLVDRKMESMVAEINRDLSYQKQLKLEAMRTRKMMEQSASDIAHDLRTPLTVIRGNLQMVNGSNLPPEERECLHAALRRTEELKVLVEEFYEISLLESGDVEVKTVPLDLTEFVKEFILDHEVMIREKGLEPVLTIPEKAVTICTDRHMLTRIMSNLMNNVYKYADGSFFLELAEIDSLARITLGNRLKDGTRVELEHLFDRTYRADKARSEGGAGLGLYIVKLLAGRIGGEIRAKEKDGILQFEIDFPI